MPPLIKLTAPLKGSGRIGEEKGEPHFDSWVLRLRGWILDGVREGKSRCSLPKR